jgi:hypothetical protein
MENFQREFSGDSTKKPSKEKGQLSRKKNSKELISSSEEIDDNNSHPDKEEIKIEEAKITIMRRVKKVTSHTTQMIRMLAWLESCNSRKSHK